MRGARACPATTKRRRAVASSTIYRHRQFGWAIAAGTAVALVLATLLAQSLSAQTIATAGWMVYALYAVIIAAFALFGWLDVEVDARAIAVETMEKAALASGVACDAGHLIDDEQNGVVVAIEPDVAHLLNVA